MTNLWRKNTDTEPAIDTSIETRGTPSDYESTAYLWYQSEVNRSMARIARYHDYDQMDEESPEVASALDIYADNATRSDSDDDLVVVINTDDEEAKQILVDTSKALCLDAETWSLARTIAKYGEAFDEIVVDGDMNIVRLKSLQGRTMTRNEDRFGRLAEKAYTQQSSEDSKEIHLLKWQVIHYRMRRTRHALYGESILSSARKVYRQLSMMEDAIVIARLTRAHNRLKYRIDTNGMTPEERLDYLDQVKRQLRKRKTIDPRTGMMNTNYNPMSVEEDVFIAVTENSRADVDVLSGQGSGGDLNDVEYFQNKMFSALKVPKAYLGLERDMNAKATLTEQDVQFARSVRRIQLAIQTGYRQLFDLALAIAGKNPKDVEYRIALPIISTIDEMRQWQIEQMKLTLAGQFKTQFRVDDEYILRNILGLTDSEIEELLDSVEELPPFNPLNPTAQFDPDKPPIKVPRVDTSDDEENLEDPNRSAKRGTKMADDLRNSKRTATTGAKTEALTNQQLRAFAYKERQRIDALREVIEWELETKRGGR